MYCKMVCGDPEFSIEEWNDALKYCNENNITGEEREKILNPELFPCKIQCADCLSTVKNQQDRTKAKL